MKIQTLSSSKAPAAIGPYSQGIKIDNLFFFSGMLPIDPKKGELTSQNIESQTEQVMNNIIDLLNDLDLTINNICKTTIFVTDIGQFSKVNDIYGSYFKDYYPARSCVEVSALPKGASIEIEVIAEG